MSIVRKCRKTPGDNSSEVKYFEETPGLKPEVTHAVYPEKLMGNCLDIPERRVRRKACCMSRKIIEGVILAELLT